MARSESDQTSALSCQISPALVGAWVLHVLAGKSWASQVGIYKSHHALHGELPTFPGWPCAVLLWAAPSPLPDGSLYAGTASPSLQGVLGVCPQEAGAWFEGISNGGGWKLFSPHSLPSEKRISSASPFLHPQPASVNHQRKVSETKPGGDGSYRDPGTERLL